MNREPYELDPELFLEPLPDYANTQSVRVAGGLGTIARIVADGEEIYRHKLPLASGLARIEQLYIPFHAALCDLIETTRAASAMPSSSTAIRCRRPRWRRPAGPRPDIVLGDRFGASADCGSRASSRMRCAALGYEVHINRPYAGGYITEHYGRPGARGACGADRDQPRALSRRADAAPDGGFDELQRDLQSLAGPLFNDLPALLERRAAAE